MLSAPNVPLPDQDTGVVDGLSQTALEDLGLETTLQEVLNLERQDVIETHARLVEHTDTDETTNQGVTLEKTLGVLVIELEQLTGCTTNLGKNETNAPDLALVAETVLACELWGGWGRDEVGKATIRTFSSASRRADSKGRRGTL